GRLGIVAPIVPAGIDTAGGALGTGTAIHRAMWWRDGAVPGDPLGALLVAGHVDSATAGPGVFYKLHLARAGDRIDLVTAGGRTGDACVRGAGGGQFRSEPLLPDWVGEQRPPCRSRRRNGIPAAKWNPY